MLLFPLRCLIWLLAFTVPAQAGAGVWLRAHGPAHLHLAASALTDSRIDRRAQPSSHGHGHAHGHAGSQIEAHGHAPSEAGVLYLGEAGDTERAGSSPAADKAAALDPPALLPAAFIARCDGACRVVTSPVVAAYASVAGAPLYRPPR
ncbi:MAG: hypothetical protein ABIX46_01340 [Burkholderiaceae bacterium]